MTLLVFFPAATRTGVVPPDLRLVAPHGRDLCVVAADARRLLLSLRTRRPERTRRRRRRARACQRRCARRVGARVVQDEGRAALHRTARQSLLLLVEHRPEPP